MTGRWTRLIGAAMAVALWPALALAALPQAELAGAARALTVSDLTGLEAFGRGSLSPDGRWAVYEKRGRYDVIPRFDYEWRSAWAAMDLWVADLRRPDAAPERLLPGEGPGLQRAAWSPSGARLLVTRFRDGRLEPGLVVLADRTVRWTGLTLDVPRAGAQADWVGEDQVVLLIRPGHDLPAALAYQGATPGRLAMAWEATARGRAPSRTILDAADGIASTPAPRPVSALVALEVQTGAVRSLVAGGISDFAVSPDGRQVAVLAGDTGAPLRPETVVQFENPFRQRLQIIDLASGAVVRPLGGREVAPGLLRWSPDSRAVLVWARPDDAAWAEGALMAAGAEGAMALRLDGLIPASALEIVLGVRADWIGEVPILHARAADGGQADWFALSATAAPRALTVAIGAVPNSLAATEGERVYLVADGGYWAVDLDGARRLTPEGETLQGVPVSDMEMATRLKVNEAPRRAWSPGRGPAGETLVLTDGVARRLGSGEGLEDRVLAASDRGALVLRRTGLMETLWVRTETSAAVIDAVNAGLAEVEPAAPEAIRHPDLDGRDTVSWLFLPRAGTPIRGLVVKVYPGSVDAGIWAGPLAMTYGFSPSVFTGAGYAVLSPALPQTGAASARGDGLVRSADLAVDAALAAHPELPEDRMAVLGHSFGGYAALEIASRTRRYRAYVASSAFTDLAGAWGELEPSTRILPEDGGMVRAAQGWAETGQARLPGPPWAAPEAYAASSPYLRADRIKDPVLLLSADMDFVPLSQSERMYSALLRTGGRVRLVTYWGEHHNLWSPANIEDRFTQILDWLALWLSPAAASGPGGAPKP